MKVQKILFLPPVHLILWQMLKSCFTAILEYRNTNSEINKYSRLHRASDNKTSSTLDAMKK